SDLHLHSFPTRRSSDLPLFAAEPIKRAGAPRLLLSLAAYSFRDYFKDSNNKRDTNADPAQRIDLFQFIDYCSQHGCQGTELTSRSEEHTSDSSHVSISY